MIRIDFENIVALTDEKTIKLPCTYYAENFVVLPVEHRDNEYNEELSEFNRNVVTRVTYEIMADVLVNKQSAVVPIKEYDTADEAKKVYDEVIDAVNRGDKIYSFRRVLENGRDNGSSSENR